jgi:rod shape-determining protein MreB
MGRRGLAIDLGTANTLVYVRGEGIVYDQPTMVALDSRTDEVMAVGGEAWEARGETEGNVVALRPLGRGAITDFEITRQMVKMILRSVGAPRFPKPKVLACVPSLLTPVERKAIEEAITSAGASSVTLVDEPLVAAIGAGLPINNPTGSMVVDVGGGNTEIGMVAMGGVVTGKSIRVGGLDMDAAVRQHVRKRYGVAISEVAAERVKIELGSAYPAADAREAEIRGRELATGLPRFVALRADEVREVLSDTVRSIVQATRDCLSESPPELAHDILETGLFLTGGGALLRGLDMRLAQDCEVPVHVTENPLTTVILGAGRLLEFLPEYKQAVVASKRS